ncbi:glycoside hydrolase family 11 protein [Paenibacillus xylaniclasticus]|uniref:glycoside hydrolase family 11 protein n=1 Tax=Paenibacillus xylaniclasticus TaxID=588083 RepID=UPI000FDCB0EB|nr:MULTISPECIES: glycoside hydrolase family 11 protein [Paenibacillus]
MPVGIANAATTITSNQTGTHDGYDFELWKDSGNTSMTLNSGGAFSATWSNINNALFRKGKKFNSTQTHQQIGNISINYAATFNPGGNSYLTVYGWTKNSLIEYYIMDNWGTYRPSGTNKGSFSVDGGTYDIYETTRVNQPSIEGTATFKQYWSIRTAKRSSGTISVSEHFKKWESLGMSLGKLYEVALTVEGFQSNGSADVTTNVLTIGGSSGGGTTPPPTSGTTKIEAESMTKAGQYTGNISSPFTGVALYANNDLVKTTHNFTTSTHSFSLRGASNNSNTARVDLKIGGVTKGSFYFTGTNPAVATLNNVNTGTGNQEIQLVVTTDNGQWDAFIDYLEIN